MEEYSEDIHDMIEKKSIDYIENNLIDSGIRITGVFMDSYAYYKYSLEELTTKNFKNIIFEYFRLRDTKYIMKNYCMIDPNKIEDYTKNVLCEIRQIVNREKVINTLLND